MSFYGDQVLPRFMDFALSGGELARLRSRVTAGLGGDVLEIGFGSGLNVPHYPPGLTRVRAVDPAGVGRKLAAKRVAACTVPVDYIGVDAQVLPLDDASVDHVLSTWTLCRVPVGGQALAEVRRVLRPGGALHFLEHGLAPVQWVAGVQNRLTPLQRRLFGGCHLNRPIGPLVTGAGLELTQLKTYYLKAPRALGYTFEGVAAKPGGR